MTVKWWMLLGNKYAACNHELFYLDWHGPLSHNENSWNVVENVYKWVKKYVKFKWNCNLEFNIVKKVQ